jgi:hypothetical protein
MGVGYVHVFGFSMLLNRLKLGLFRCFEVVFWRFGWLGTLIVFHIGWRGFVLPCVNIVKISVCEGCK